jgi:hypothetical protein
VELEVCQDSNCLLSLPLYKVQEDLTFPAVRVFAVDPRGDLFGQHFIYAKGPTCSLSVEALGRSVVKMRIVYGLLFGRSLRLFLFEQKLICYDKG